MLPSRGETTLCKSIYKRTPETMRNFSGLTSNLPPIMRIATATMN